jgi:hypothetical protein|tara:strand:+ start:733 stop:1311 length:579 start_codon:yes stop_codon:yes gene_type:complete
MTQPTDIPDSRTILKCLQWATNFAEGSQEADETLDNPNFNSWLIDCHGHMRNLHAVDAGLNGKEERAINSWWADRYHQAADDRDALAKALHRVIECFDDGGDMELRYLDKNQSIVRVNAIEKAHRVLVDVLGRLRNSVIGPACEYKVRYDGELCCWVIVQVFESGAVGSPVAQTIEQNHAELLCQALNEEGE